MMSLSTQVDRGRGEDPSTLRQFQRKSETRTLIVQKKYHLLLGMDKM